MHELHAQANTTDEHLTGDEQHDDHFDTRRFLVVQHFQEEARVVLDDLQLHRQVLEPVIDLEILAQGYIRKDGGQL